MARYTQILLSIFLITLATSAAFAVCVAPTPPLAPGTVADYQKAVGAFVSSGCFLTQWTSDPAPHLTGNTVGGITYSVHDQIRVFYSPAMLAWLQKNRPDGLTTPAQVATIPDRAAMVAAIYPISGLPTLVPSPTGYLVMIRQAGKRATDPASGWFFSQIVIDAAKYGGTRVTSSMGNYSLGLCVACHASAVNNLTFASFANTKKPPPSFPYTPNFVTQGTSSLLSALTPPANSQLRQPLGDGPAQQFIDFFNSAVPEFQKKPLPPVSRLPMSKVLSIPAQITDNVYLRPNQAAFITSNQCQGCHDSTALLSMQSAQPGAQRQWAPTATSYKYSVQGPGSAPKGGDKFNISQYGEWSVSIMALASRDPAFLSQVETERVLHSMVEPTSVDNFCYRCHGPMGQRQIHIDAGGDPTQFPPGTPLKPQPNFSHLMTYSTPGGCNYQGFPCNKPGAQPAFAKYGALARDSISCAMCHHLGPHDGPPPTDPWEVFYGFKNPPVAGLEKPAGFPYPFAGSVQYNLKKFAAPEPDAQNSYNGAARFMPGSKPAVANIFGHLQNFNVSTVTRDFMPKGELCGGCHVVIAPEIPIAYPKVRNSYQIDPDHPNAPPKPAMYPNTNKPCPPVKPLPNGKYNPTVDPCVQQSFEQSTYLEWAASASFGGATPQTSCTFCHMPNAEGRMMAIANINGPGTVASDSSIAGIGGFPKSQYRADDQVSVSANASYPRHRLMAINLFVHEMFQQFPNILGISDSTEAAVPPGTVKNLQNAEESILTHAPTTVSLSLCKPGTANTPCSKLTADPKNLTYQVTVQNFSGHRFPTGAGFRRGFLEFRLLDRAGKTLWVSGAVNQFGAIVDNTGKILTTEFPPGDVKYNPIFLQPHFGSQSNPAITRQDQVQIYETRATNEYGQLTTATTRLFGDAKDNRIPPAGWIAPYNCQGKIAPGTADPNSARMVNGLNGFALSLVTAPQGISGAGPGVMIDPAGAFSDPDFCTPGGVINGLPSGSAGVDHILYKIPINALNGATVAKIQVIMHYQSIPPYFLRDRFYDGQTYSNPTSEGGVVGLGAATERLLYATSHLDTKINNTVPQQQGLPSLVSNNWTMDIGSACFAEVAGASCPPPAISPALLPERIKIPQGTYK
jgi:hypothetical protein